MNVQFLLVISLFSFINNGIAMDKTEFGSNSEVNKLGNLTSNAKIENVKLTLDQKNIFNNENVYRNKEDNFNNDIKDNKTSYNQETGTVIQLQKDSLLQNIVKDCKTEEEFCNLVQKTSAKILEIFENIKAGQQVNAQQLMSEFKTELEQNMFQQAIINISESIKKNNNIISNYFHSSITKLKNDLKLDENFIKSLYICLSLSLSQYIFDYNYSFTNKKELYLSAVYLFYLSSIYENLFNLINPEISTIFQRDKIITYLEKLNSYNLEQDEAYQKKLMNLLINIDKHICKIPDYN